MKNKQTRKNGFWLTAIAFDFLDEKGKHHFGSILKRGKPPSEIAEFLELATSAEKFERN